MIIIAFDENSPFGLFIRARADLEGKNTNAIAKDFAERLFKDHVLALHARFMQGEFSQGKLADLLDLPRIELIRLLEMLGLPVTNV